MELNSLTEKNLTSSNINHSFRSFQPLEENISLSPNANGLSKDITHIDLECSLFMDETSEDLSNYLNTPLPECSKSVIGNDFESKTMNHLSRNIKRKYQKNRGLKKNNKFFKSKTVDNTFMDSNEIPVINEVMRKIFRPSLDKQDIKDSPKVSLKTYSHKLKTERNIQIIETFGLPDEPLVSVLNQCIKEQDSVNLDVDKVDSNNTLLSNPYSILSGIDPTINMAHDFRRRSFSLFEDIAPSVSDSLESEVKEAFKFEETSEEEAPIPKSNMLLWSLPVQNVREPKIFLEPLNLDDQQIFKANNLSLITNKKNLLFQRLRSYSKNIEDSQVKMLNSTDEVSKTNRDEECMQSKNDVIFRDDSVKFITNSADLKIPTTLDSKHSRRSARLVNRCNDKGIHSHLNLVKDDSVVEANMQSACASLLNDRMQLRRNKSNTNLHETTNSTFEGVSNNNVKVSDVTMDEKILGNKKNSFNANNSIVESILVSPKRITRQSAQTLVEEKLLNVFTSDINVKPSRNGDDIKIEDTGHINHIRETKEIKNGNFVSPVNNLKNKKLVEHENYLSYEFEKKRNKIKCRGTMLKETTETNLADHSHTITFSNTHLCDKEKDIPTGSIKVDEMGNEKFNVEQSSAGIKTNLRRSRRGLEKILRDGVCKKIVDRNITNCVADSNSGNDICSHNSIEENIKWLGNSSYCSLQNRSYDDADLKGKQKSNDIQRISSRLRSKSVPGLRIFRKLSVKDIKDIDEDIETASSLKELDYLNMYKNNGLNLQLTNSDKISHISGSADKKKMVDHLKSPLPIKNHRKTCVKPNERSKLYFSENNSKILNDVKSSTFNKNDKCNGIQLKAENKLLKSMSKNGNQLILATVGTSVHDIKQKKKQDCATSEKNAGKTIFFSKKLLSKQKKICKTSPYSDKKPFKPISDFKNCKKKNMSTKLPKVNKTQRECKLVDEGSTELIDNLEETYKRQTHSKSPRKNQQQEQLSEKNSNVEVIFDKRQKKLKSVVAKEFHIKQGNQIGNSIKAKHVESNKLMDDSVSNSPRKNHQGNENKFCVASEECSTELKFVFEDKKEIQNFLDTPSVNKMQNKNKKLNKSSKIETPERVSCIDKQFTSDYSKKDDTLDEKLELFSEHVLDINTSKTLICPMSPTDSKSHQKHDHEFSESLAQSVETLISFKMDKILPSPIESKLNENETMVKSRENGFSSKVTIGDNLKSYLTSESIDENVINLKVSQKKSNTLDKQWINELQPKEIDKYGGFSAEDSIKSTVPMVEVTKLPMCEKVDKISNCNEILPKSTGDCLIIEDVLNSEDHLVNLKSKDNYQNQNECSEHTKNDLQKSEVMSDVSSRLFDRDIPEAPSAQDYLKSASSVESTQLPFYEKAEQDLKCNENLIQKSTEDCLILGDMPTITQEHSVNVIPKKQCQNQNEYNEHSKNNVEKSEWVSNVLNSIAFNESINSYKQKLHHCQKGEIQNGEYAKKSTSKYELILPHDFKMEESRANPLDYKIGDIVDKQHLPNLKKDESIPNNEFKLSVNKMDSIFDTKFEKKADSLKTSPTMFNRNDESRCYSAGKELGDSIDLKEYLDLGYDIHRRTSFRKILERVMAMSRLDVEGDQKEACRLQRCKSVPHEKLNSTKTSCTSAVSLSVDNTLKYPRNDKHPVMKRIDISKVKKRLDYFADPNISCSKQTNQNGTKSLHITQTSAESELTNLKYIVLSSSEMLDNHNKTENEMPSMIQKDMIPIKRKRAWFSESDQCSASIKEENARHIKMSSSLLTEAEKLKLIGMNHTASKSEKLAANEVTNVKITKDVNHHQPDRDDTLLKLFEPKMLALDSPDNKTDQTCFDEPLPKKRCMSLSKNIDKLNNELSSSMRECKSVIRKLKKKSKRGSRRLTRIPQLESNYTVEWTDANSIGSHVNSNAAKKVIYEFKVGDSIWGKVGNYPYWPCVIVLDPVTSEFKKYKSSRINPYYHVRFFGDKGKRAWTNHVIPYAGPDDLDSMANKFRREGVQTMHIRESYCIKPSQYVKWKKAVSEAETMKNESVECKLNFFKEIFCRENRVSVYEGIGDLSSIKNDSMSKVKNKKKNQIEEESGQNLRQYEKEKIPMNISSVISCISDVISKYGSSDNDCNSTQETEFLSKNSTSRRKRKKKKKDVDNGGTEDSSGDLGIELLNLPPSNMGSVIVESELNILGSLEDKLLSEESSPYETPPSSTKNDSVPDRSKIMNGKILKDTNKIEVLNHSISDINTSIDIHNSSASIQTRSRSLPRLRDSRAKDDSMSKSDCCTISYESASTSIPFSAPKLKDKKQNVDQSDSESRASDNSLVNNSVYRLSQLKKNLFRGVAKEKICQICEKSVDVVKCRGPCNGDYHIRCVENSLKVTNEKVADLFKNESVCDRDQDERNEQVQIITISSGKKLLDNVTLSPSNREISLTETQIDRKMKEIMNQIELNESYNAEFLESTDSGGDDVDYNLKQDSKSYALLKHNYRNSDRLQKSKGVFKHVTADDVSIISFTDDGTVKHKSVPDDPNAHMKETHSLEDCAYKCPFCTSSVVPVCFVCNSIMSKNGNIARQRCSLQKCGRFFHLECLNIWPQTQWSFILHEKRKSEAIDSFVCPRHVCHTCASENLGYSMGRCPNDKLVKCLRCPATYHNSYHCVPAGSQILTTTQIICPRHTQDTSRRPVTCNTVWCFVCSEGGNLICCETCPTSVHAECLPVNFMDDDSYICEDCESGRFPLYDEVVWVKCGTFRWWPAIILLPSEVPQKVEAKPHNEGDFVVKFFGTYDYFWVGRGRTFSYQEGDTGYLNSNKNRIDEAFSRALKEAADVYRLKKESKSKRDIEINNGLKPPSYVRIKVNRPVGNARVFDGNLSNTTSCDCDPREPNPCGPNTNCLNRILLTECNPDLCPSGQKCNNQCFEKREYPQVIPYRTEGRGWGLKTMEFIQKGQFIIEYVGEIIDDEEYQRRINRMHQQKDENYYFLTIDNNRMLDAGPKGNAARFMNHSCQPNCETQKWTVNGDTRVGLFAIEDIAADTELTFNYNLQCTGTDKKICKCGASNCSGYIGVKPDDHKPARKIPTEKKKRRESQEEKTNKRSCFVCGKNGDVGICSTKSCRKSYHLKCVQLEFWPDGKWSCPSHSCNICSRRTTRSCVQCTNSFCPVHSNGNVRYDSQLGFVCSEHDPDIQM
ncbi:hypothetical protein WA026_008655 [Henosepilachna vigintioctopunctata]|uniref:Uncharacterized protein n=1 Tax=Henosepilachna vigintioctopunctata TaxID=420089 RepID=A0AAW1UGF3_9CUCU